MKTLRSGLIAVLDIGTTKIGCFVARLRSNSLEIIGIGHQVSQGIYAGTVTDIKAAEAAIMAAVNAAEHMAGENIDQVVVNISGAKLISRHVQVSLSVAGHEINTRDTKRLINMATDQCQEEEYALIHAVPLHFTLDDAIGIKDPTGMVGKHLSADIHVMSVSATSLLNITNVLARCHLDVADFVVSPYASALSCLHQDEKELGVTLLDIGGASTDIAIFKQGEIIFVGSLPIGGIHITKDIAHGLAVDVATAERVKTLYGSIASGETDSHEIIDIPALDEQSEVQYVSRVMLSEIITPRVEEICEMTKACIEKAGMLSNVGNRIVLTGGASQLVGIKEVVSDILKRQVRIANPYYIEGLAESTKGPAFSTLIGLLTYVVKYATLVPYQEKTDRRNMIGRVLQWFRENF